MARSLTVILTAVLLGPMLSPVAGGPGAAALASPALPGPAETVLPPDTVGYLPWHFYLEGTVDLASGNLYFTAEDASVASIGEDALEHQVIASSDPQPHPTRDLLLRRAYNSGMASVDSPFGFGWSHSYGGVLSPSTLPELSDDMIYQDESGAIHLFLATADGFTSPPGNYARLQAILDGWELLSKDGVVRRFDAGGKLVSVLDASKNELTIEYAAGRIHRVTGFHGISLRFEANADGRVQRVTDDLGRRWDYEYDASGNLIRVIDPLGFERLYRYDAAHLLTDAIDRAGIGLRVTYGGGIVREFGTFLHRYGPDTDTLVLRTHTLMYAPEHVVVHGPRGGKTMVQMDGSGAPVKVVDALGGTTRYAYDADHNPVRFQDARGSITLYEYDARGNNVRVVDPLGSVLTRTWENIDLPDRFQSLLTSFTNRRGFTGSLRYDSFGRTTELVTPGGSVTYTYDAEGSPGSVTNTRGNRRSFLFDRPTSRLIEGDEAGQLSEYTYDAVGRRVRSVDAAGATTAYTYDANDRLTERVDGLGGVWRYAYNPNGALEATTDPLGRASGKADNLLGQTYARTDAAGGAEDFVYDAAGNLIAKADQLGAVTRYEYDLLDRLVRRVDPVGHAVEYTYDRGGNVRTERDGFGVTRYEYDALSRLTKRTDALGQVERAEYDAEGNVVREVRKGGGVFEYAYDALDRLLQVTDPLGGVEAFEYDGEGNVLQRTDPNGRVSLFEYDLRDRLSAVTDPLGHRRTFTYDAMGRLLTDTDARGATTENTYDLLGRLVRTRDALGNTRLFVFNPVGRTTEAHDARGGVTRYTYDALDRLVAETDPLGQTATFAYDAAGDLVSRTDRTGLEETFAYDARRRLLSHSIPGLGPERYEYDERGRVTAVEDRMGGTTRYSYDALDRLTSEEDPLGQTTTYAYGPLDMLDSLTDANGGTTTYTYDSLRRLTGVRSPLGNLVSYEHDAAGNRIGRTDPDGRTTRYLYDAGNRLTRIVYGGGGHVALTYDEEGNLLREATAGSGPGTTATYTYDLLGRRTRAVRSYVAGPASAFTRALQFTYDPEGNLASYTTAFGSVAYAYDAANRPVSITDSAAGTFAFLYDAEGRRMMMTYPNGARATYAYDAPGRMVSLVNRDPSMAVISSYTYAYDALSRRTSRTDGSGTTAYTYDAAGRLVREASPGGTTDWTYDAAGNRLTQMGPGGGTSYEYDIENRLVSEGLTTYLHDRSGNRISRNQAGETTRYTYDHENRLTRVVLPDRRVVDYRYAGDGTRIEQSGSGLLPGERVFFAYLGDDLIEEWTQKASVARYVQGPNVDEPLLMQRASVNYFYTADGQGSVTALLNDLGAAVRSYVYSTWGKTIGGSGTLSQPFQYTARERDTATGLYYYRARTYDPNVGRFLQKDPLASLRPMAREEDANLYAYVGDDPVNFVDPTGYSQHTVRGTTLNGKEYWFDEYDEKSVREAQKLIDDAYAATTQIANDVNQWHKDMLASKHRLESARDTAWYGFFLNLAGIAVTLIGFFTANPFIAALGISLALHQTAFDIASGESALDTASGAVKSAGGETVDRLSDQVGPALKKIAKGVKALSFISDLVGAMGKLGDARKHGDALEKAREANEKHRQDVATGVYDEMFQGMIDYAKAKAQELAEKDRKTGEPVPTGGGGRRRPDPPRGDGEPTPTQGGGSTGGIVAPDGGLDNVPDEIDPFREVPIPIEVKNFGRTDLMNATLKVRVYPEPAARRVLLVVDESDGANVLFEQALDDIGVPFDEVFVDTEYTPRWKDGDPLTKDLADYDTVLWETSNDRTGTLALPAQPELAKYLDHGGCLFLGGDGFMAEWPEPEGTLMSDWMFADGYGGDTFDFQVEGVPGTIGDGLTLVLEGGDGLGLHATGASLSGVKTPGEPAFLYNKSLAAVQGENSTANGTYKSILASFEFASISTRLLRDVLMERVIEYLTCQPVAGGDTPVPTLPSTWDTPGMTTTVTTTVVLEPGRYVITVSLVGGGDTYTPNNHANIPLIVKPPNVITGCGEISEPGEYTVAEDLVSEGGCLLITADDVTIHGDGHSIHYGALGGAGIQIQGGDVLNVRIDDLRVIADGPGTSGLVILGGREGNEMTGLQLVGADRGILLLDTYGVTLTENTVQANAVGIFVQGAGPPPLGQPLLAYDNLFVNGQNALDFTGRTQWNLPAPDCTQPNIIGGLCRGGNAWDDYLGIDLDGDGIGDTDIPYTSGGGIAVDGDFLPLTNNGP